MTSLLAHLEESILSRKLLSRGQSILVAVSGGMDSMVLLHVLRELSQTHGWKLTVAHFNHKLRGRSSDADELFVKRSAEKLGLRFITQHANVRKFAKEKGLSIEMAARRLRHDFFARTASRLKIPTVALAHHADDQVELFFLRLFRGASGKGLGGMKWSGVSPSDAKVQLVRPLLDQPKATVREFAKENRIQFREDATNAVLDFQRNRIRRELLPLLRQKYQPSLNRMILRLMEIIGAEADFVSDYAKQFLETRKQKKFGALPVAVQRSTLQLQLLSHGITPDFALIESLRLAARRAVSVSPELSVLRDDVGGIHLEPIASRPLQPKQAVVELRKAGEIKFDEVQISWEADSEKSFAAPQRSTNCECFDAEKVGSKIILRHWRAGDRFQPIGMSRAVKLQDLFTNKKILREDRHRLIVATTADGEIFWVEKLRIGERFKLDRHTVYRLKWSWRRH